jgi:cold shock protein
MQRGTVKFFNPQKGYGFIMPDGKIGAEAQDVFVHISAVERAGLKALRQGQIVEYELLANPDRRLSAHNLKIVG